MSLSAIFIKIVGVVLVFVGLSLVLSAVGLGFLGASFLGPVWSLILGALFIGAGIYIIRGGTITA